LVASVRPAGSVEAVENVVAPNPPVCVKVWLNAAFAVPVVVAGLVTVMVGQPMVRVYVAPVPLQPLPSVALTLIGKLPIWVGVPQRVPLADSVRPVGSVLAVVKVVAPTAPVCVKIWLNGAPTVAVFTAGLVIAMAWHPTTRL